MKSVVLSVLLLASLWIQLASSASPDPTYEGFVPLTQHNGEVLYAYQGTARHDDAFRGLSSNRMDTDRKKVRSVEVTPTSKGELRQGSARKLEEDKITGYWRSAKFLNYAPGIVYIGYQHNCDGEDELLILGDIPDFSAKSFHVPPPSSFQECECGVFFIAEPVDSTGAFEEWTWEVGKTYQTYDRTRGAGKSKKKSKLDCRVQGFVQPFTPMAEWTESSSDGRKYGALQQLLPEQTDAFFRLKEKEDIWNQYRRLTGEEYLPTISRHRPLHPIWKGETHGQHRKVASSETQFVALPEKQDIERSAEGSNKEILSKYRTSNSEMIMRLDTLAPNVFEVRNFLSTVETRYLTGLVPSDMNFPTRSLDRKESPIVDAIVKRVGDLLQIEDEFMQPPSDMVSSVSSVEHDESKIYAGPLQLSREDGHDGHFGDANHDEGRYNVFVTVLFFLNDDAKGGEIVFPNAYKHDNTELKVEPEAGKAVLFYSMLPDGNHDIRSEHHIQPSRAGHQWTAKIELMDLLDYDDERIVEKWMY